jgi:uncharacterized membrane protein
MIAPTEHPSELFLRFNQRSMAGLLVIVLLLGGSGLSLMLSPSHEVFRVASRVALAVVAIVLMVALPMSIWRRRWAADSPEVKVVVGDEWRRTNMDRASRAAFIVVLSVQYPLVLIFGFFMRLPAPRGAMAMMASTVTLGLATLLALFLYFDRE